jgi:hypothetical protein
MWHPCQVAHHVAAETLVLLDLIIHQKDWCDLEFCGRLNINLRRGAFLWN